MRLLRRLSLLGDMAAALETKRLLKLSWWELMRSSLSMSKGEGGMSMRDQLRYSASAARADKVMFGGDENAGSLSIGQIIGAINDVPTCQELIERVVAEAEKVLQATTEKALDKIPT